MVVDVRLSVDTHLQPMGVGQKSKQFHCLFRYFAISLFRYFQLENGREIHTQIKGDKERQRHRE